LHVALESGRAASIRYTRCSASTVSALATLHITLVGSNLHVLREIDQLRILNQYGEAINPTFPGDSVGVVILK
jgi:hypothetical protein